MPIQRRCPEAPVYHRDLSDEATLFKALGDPARVTILATLARTDHEVCVCDFTSGLDLNQSTVSHHLKLLKDAGLVTSVRRGTWGYYSLAPDARVRLEAALASVLPVKVDYALFLTDEPSLELALDHNPATAVREGAHYGVVVETYYVVAEVEERDHQATTCCKTESAATGTSPACC
jgi:ArsR family transcriptional regulator